MYGLTSEPQFLQITLRSTDSATKRKIARRGVLRERFSRFAAVSARSDAPSAALGTRPGGGVDAALGAPRRGRHDLTYERAEVPVGAPVGELALRSRPTIDQLEH